MMTNLIAAAILIIMVGAASFYIWKAKKSGRKCIGCPMSGSCSSNKSCSCHTDNTGKTTS